MVLGAKVKLINSLKNFQKGLLSFFGYVNKENKNVEMLDDKYEDEFGNMAKIVNENILKTKATIDSDNKFLEQILPLYNQGFGWILPALLTAIFAYAISKLSCNNYNNSNSF